MFRFIKKLFFSFTWFSFQTWFHDADYVLYYPQMYVFSFHIFLFSYITLLYQFLRRDIERMLTFPYSYNWQQQFNNKMNEKRSQEYRMDPEYVTEQINSHMYSGASFETILLFDFCTISKTLICFSLIKYFSNNHKRYSRHLQMSILYWVAPIKVYLTIIYKSL